LQALAHHGVAPFIVPRSGEMVIVRNTLKEIGPAVRYRCLHFSRIGSPAPVIENLVPRNPEQPLTQPAALPVILPSLIRTRKTQSVSAERVVRIRLSQSKPQRISDQQQVWHQYVGRYRRC